MQEYGIQVSDSVGQRMNVYFMPMSYIDWVKYSDAGVASSKDPSVVRYLLKTYITRTFTNEYDNNGDPVQVEGSADIICDMPPGVQDTIVGAMFTKSGFDMDDEEYSELISKLERKSRTLMGCYDYFLFMHGGLEFYTRCLELDSRTRAQIIMLMEKTTGISVKKRFHDSVTLETPLDLVSENSKYEGKMRTDMRSGRVQKTHRDGTLPDGTEQVKENLPPDLNQMLNSSRSALERELRNASAGKRKAFDWQADEAAITGVDVRQEKDIYNMEKKPPNNNPSQGG